jgi:2-polyprenyl-3-methyl-5-hydroxy-6-metoxy-1,4-benzoquinol methylase
MRSEAIRSVIHAYDDPVVKAYCWGRFWILRQRFLDEIGQYLPATGRVLDVGCGFGLFSLYFASVGPRLTLHGIDRNARRIAQARGGGGRLGRGTVGCETGEGTGFRGSARYDAAYMLDIVHHIPEETVAPLVGELAKTLPPGGRLIVKDVERHPAWKRWFTHALDKVMDPRSPVRYWGADELQPLIERAGFRVYRHLMVDLLPYPHVLYIAERLP